MREQRESEPSGFSAPPPDLPESQEIATSPELRKAELEWLKLRERVFICRAVAGALAYAAGLGIIVYVVCTALPNVKEAWEERNSFTAAATGERLRYLIAFFTFKAAAIGGSFTVGMLLIRAGNLLSGGRGEAAPEHGEE